MRITLELDPRWKQNERGVERLKDAKRLMSRREREIEKERRSSGES